MEVPSHQRDRYWFVQPSAETALTPQAGPSQSSFVTITRTAHPANPIAQAWPTLISRRLEAPHTWLIVGACFGFVAGYYGRW